MKRLKAIRIKLIRKLARINGRIRKRRQRSAAFARAERAEATAKRLIALDPPYRWGGAHNENPANITTSSGGDCSSYWSEIVQSAVPGFNTTNTIGMINEIGMGSILRPGPGKYVTLYIKDDHVIGSIFGRFTQMGGNDNPRSNGGPTWFVPTSERLHEFPHIAHPAGL